MKIDSHHHFWKYNPTEYSWMNEDMGVLKHDHLPAGRGRVARALPGDLLEHGRLVLLLLVRFPLLL